MSRERARDERRWWTAGLALAAAGAAAMTWATALRMARIAFDDGARAGQFLAEHRDRIRQEEPHD